MLPMKMKVRIDTHCISDDYIYTLTDRGKLSLDSNYIITYEYIDTIFEKNHEIELKYFKKNKLDEVLGEVLLRIERESIYLLCNGNIECYFTASSQKQCSIEKGNNNSLQVAETKEIIVKVQDSAVISIKIM